MAKWDERMAGSSMHQHLSLWDATAGRTSSPARRGWAGSRRATSFAGSSAGGCRARRSSRCATRRRSIPTSVSRALPSLRRRSRGVTTTGPPASAWSAKATRCGSSAASRAPMQTRTSPMRPRSPRGSTESNESSRPEEFRGNAYQAEDAAARPEEPPRRDRAVRVERLRPRGVRRRIRRALPALPAHGTAEVRRDGHRLGAGAIFREGGTL